MCIEFYFVLHPPPLTLSSVLANIVSVQKFNPDDFYELNKIIKAKMELVLSCLCPQSMIAFV